MASVLVDTNILIDHLRGKVAATEFLKDSVLQNNKLFCSVITRIELMSGMRPGETPAIKKLLESFEEVEVTIEIADIAGLYMNKYAKSHGMNAADAIIAASAKHVNAQLYTLNTKHFPMKDIKILNPY